MISKCFEHATRRTCRSMRLRFCLDFKHLNKAQPLLGYFPPTVFKRFQNVVDMQETGLAHRCDLSFFCGVVDGCIASRGSSSREGGW